MRFSKQEHWSGLPGPFPEDLPDPGIEAASLMSPALAELVSASASWEARSLSTEVCWVTQPKKTGICLDQGFPAGSGVKDPPAKQQTPVQSLGGEDPLDREVATHSSILAWKMLWTEEPGGLQFVGLQSQTRLKRLNSNSSS